MKYTSVNKQDEAEPVHTPSGTARQHHSPQPQPETASGLPLFLQQTGTGDQFIQTKLAESEQEDYEADYEADYEEDYGEGQTDEEFLEEIKADPEAHWEFVSVHRGFLGRLNAESLEAAVFPLVSGAGADRIFAHKVVETLSQHERVSFLQFFLRRFALPAGDASTKKIALSKNERLKKIVQNEHGRAFFSTLVDALPQNDWKRALTSIIQEGYQEEREGERLEELKRILEEGGNREIRVVYGMPPITSDDFLAQWDKRDVLKFGVKNLAHLAQLIDDAYYTFSVQRGSVRQIRIVSHGGESYFHVGEGYPLSKLLGLPTGWFEAYMMEGGTVFLDGCEVAKGFSGRVYLYHVGRIFFGNKSGYLQGSSIEVMEQFGGREGHLRTLRWPDDFNDIQTASDFLSDAGDFIMDELSEE